jgi:hypothetical protein
MVLMFRLWLQSVECRLLHTTMNENLGLARKTRKQLQGTTEGG